MAGKYYIDYSDPGWPEVRPLDDWDFDSTPPEGMTLAQAKAEIIESFQLQIKHARAVIGTTRRLRTIDIDKP